MELPAAGALPLLCSLLLAFSPAVGSDASVVPRAGLVVSEALVLGEENLAPWATGLLRFTPGQFEPIAPSPNARFPLTLAAKRTKRPDVLLKFKLYRGGWDITNRHYWTSVGFTGAAGFILAFLWFILFGLALLAHHCCNWSINIKDKGFSRARKICLIFLLLFTCAALVGCILLSVGQDEFHGEVLDTLNFVVNQSDFTVQILRNVTEFLSLAKTINVDQVILPSDVQGKIDKLNVDLNDAATMLSEKTTENSRKIKQIFGDVRCALIAVAAVMLVIAVVGFLLSLFRHQHAIYIFIFSGWLLVAVTFILCGVFLIVNNAISDTCLAMNEWVHNPQAETALSSILPCIDERTSNLTLRQSKEVVLQLVNVVNTAIDTIVNADPSQLNSSYYYNQSGPLMPALCSPYDSRLNDHQCEPSEVSLDNASMIWQNYTCTVSASGSCITVGRVTPNLYKQLEAAINASYALDHYTPLLLSLHDCNFVRETFDTITSHYCPRLEHNLGMVNAGLAMISSGVMLCLVLWILYANRPRREEAFVKSEVKLGADNAPAGRAGVPL
uniref:Transcription elongation factor SPT6 n=1 Tax=Anthurium amnicola TaxID=1678845 RepID=A0A1D1Z2W9_9ARAE